MMTMKLTRREQKMRKLQLMIDREKMEDAKVYHEKYPGLMTMPTTKEIEALKVGHYVNLTFKDQSNNFECKITEIIPGGKFKGIWTYTSCFVSFEAKNILHVFDEGEQRMTNFMDGLFDNMSFQVKDVEGNVVRFKCNPFEFNPDGIM